jgi:hypothetical protein
MPLEVEIFRNYKHNLIGKKLRNSLKTTNGECEPSSWYRKAQALVETEMQDIAENSHEGQINAETLQDEAAEMLQLYIDNQVLYLSNSRGVFIIRLYGCVTNTTISTLSLIYYYRKLGNKCVWWWREINKKERPLRLR